MNWLHYLIEANVYLGAFYLCYCLLLARDTHYNLRRTYLLVSCVFAFVLPFTQLGVLKTQKPANYAEQPVAVEAAKHKSGVIILNAEDKANAGIAVKQAPAIDFNAIWVVIYGSGAAIALAVFAFRLYRLVKLTQQNRAEQADNYKLVKLSGDNTAFSFFNYLFVGTETEQSSIIITHELVHIRQKHSADIIFMEIIKAFNWFNPTVYLMQRSLKTLHEYIADEQTAAAGSDALTYSSFLLNNAYGLQGSTIVQSFFNHNLLKKRIIMLHQKKSGRLARLKYLAVLPLSAGMLCASTLVFSKNYAFIDLSPAKGDTVLAAGYNPKFGKDYILKEDRYIVNDKDEYVTVKITDKNGKSVTYDNTTASAADKKMLADKYNFSFQKYYGLKETRARQNAFDPNVDKGMAPPAPTAIAMPFVSISSYVDQRVRMPKTALDAKVNTYFIASLKIDANKKITGLSQSKKVGYGIDEAFEKAVLSYPFPIEEAPGTYKFGVTVYRLGMSVPVIPADVKNSVDYKGDITVLGLTTEQQEQLQNDQQPRKNRRPPPPPPAMPRKVGKLNNTPPPPPPAEPSRVSRKTTPPPPPPTMAVSSMLKVNALDQAPPPPPPAKPARKKSAKVNQLKDKEAPATTATAASNDLTIEGTDVSYRKAPSGYGDGMPAVIADNKLVKLPAVKTDEVLNFHADKIIFYTKSNSPLMNEAAKKYGDSARNGVIELTGKYTIKVEKAYDNVGAVKSADRRISVVATDSIIYHRSGSIIAAKVPGAASANEFFGHTTLQIR